MKPDDNSPFNFDDPDAFDQLDNVFDQTKAADQPTVDNPPKADDPFSFDDNSEFDLGEETDFNFDQPQSHDSIELNEEIADLAEPVRIMDCVCTKCAEKTEVDLAQMSPDGFIINCSSCNKQIHINRESCACRAKRKSYEINCANCGKPLDQQVHCHSCGTNFPDYFVTFDPNVARKKARNDFFAQKWAAIRDFDFTFKPVFKSNSHDAAFGYSPQSKTASSTIASSKLFSRKIAVLSIYLIVAVALIAGGVFAYHTYKSGQIYAENYFKALYCIKTGIDSNIKTSTLLKTEWESAVALGIKSTPGISNKDEAKATKLRTEVEKYMQKMAEPPKRFSQANENLIKIHGIYLDTETLVQSRPNSPQELGKLIDNISKKMVMASQELKAKLPESLKAEFEITKLKYRGMKDF